jgi:hypothetical protein
MQPQEVSIAKGWCTAAEGGEGGGAVWHNPAQVVLEGNEVVVIEDDHRYADPRRFVFSIDGLSIEIREHRETIENGVEIWGSLFLQEKGGNWFTRALNALLGKKQVKFEESERHAFEAFAVQVRARIGQSG